MSHPLRVRGLKHPNLLSYNTSFSVASFTGAWVETVILIMVCNHILSHPLRVRGLKHKSWRNGYWFGSRILYGCVGWNTQKLYERHLWSVASFTGAWVETKINSPTIVNEFVASFTGAWVETFNKPDYILMNRMSHPLRVRGLKLQLYLVIKAIKMSHPLRVRGLKRQYCRFSR